MCGELASFEMHRHVVVGAHVDPDRDQVVAHLGLRKNDPPFVVDEHDQLPCRTDERHRR